jgi:hypothetical protein
VGATIGKTGLLKFDSTTNQNIAGITTVRFNLDLSPSSSLPCTVYRDFRVSTI